MICVGLYIIILLFFIIPCRTNMICWLHQIKLEPFCFFYFLFIFFFFGLRKTKRNQLDGFVTLCQSNWEPFHSWNLKFDGSTITEIGNLVFKVQGGLHLILPKCFALHWFVEPKYYTFFLILPFFNIKSSIF